MHTCTFRELHTLSHTRTRTRAALASVLYFCIVHANPRNSAYELCSKEINHPAKPDSRISRVDVGIIMDGRCGRDENL